MRRKLVPSAPLAQLRDVDEDAWKTLMRWPWATEFPESNPGSNKRCQAIAALLLGDEAVALGILEQGARHRSMWPKLTRVVARGPVSR